MQPAWAVLRTSQRSGLPVQGGRMGQLEQLCAVHSVQRTRCRWCCNWQAIQGEEREELPGKEDP